MKKNTPTKPPTDQDPAPLDPRQKTIRFFVDALMEMVEEGVKAKRLARMQNELSPNTQPHE